MFDEKVQLKVQRGYFGEVVYIEGKYLQRGGCLEIEMERDMGGQEAVSSINGSHGIRMNPDGDMDCKMNLFPLAPRHLSCGLGAKVMKQDRG